MALRYLAEDLNHTEFGFYFVNYHSRLPVVGVHAGTLDSVLNIADIFTNIDRYGNPGTTSSSIRRTSNSLAAASIPSSEHPAGHCRANIPTVATRRSRSPRESC